MFEFINIFKNLFFTASYSVNAFKKPLTKEEEEYHINKKLLGSIESRNILIEHNLRLVAHIVKKFENFKYMQDDLIGIGTVGLIKAVDTFDKSKKIKLTTYAARCIQNEILMYFRKSNKWSKDVSLNEKIGYDKDGNAITLSDILKESEEDFSTKEYEKDNIKHLKEYLNLLNNRERSIINERYGLDYKKPKTQKEIAKNLNISRSYVSRIEKRALTKMLKEFIKNKNII